MSGLIAPTSDQQDKGEILKASSVSKTIVQKTTPEANALKGTPSIRERCANKSKATNQAYAMGYFSDAGIELNSTTVGDVAAFAQSTIDSATATLAGKNGLIEGIEAIIRKINALTAPGKIKGELSWDFEFEAQKECSVQLMYNEITELRAAKYGNSNGRVTSRVRTSLMTSMPRSGGSELEVVSLLSSAVPPQSKHPVKKTASFTSLHTCGQMEHFVTVTHEFDIDIPAVMDELAKFSEDLGSLVSSGTDAVQAIISKLWNMLTGADPTEKGKTPPAANETEIKPLLVKVLKAITKSLTDLLGQQDAHAILKMAKVQLIAITKETETALVKDFSGNARSARCDDSDVVIPPITFLPKTEQGGTGLIPTSPGGEDLPKAGTTVTGDALASFLTDPIYERVDLWDDQVLFFRRGRPGASKVTVDLRDAIAAELMEMPDLPSFIRSDAAPQEDLPEKERKAEEGKKG
ncbi:MAG: hypothetical protein AAFO93_03450 [Pseudomonadota bacterium]